MVDAALMESQEIEVVRTQALTWPEKVRDLVIQDAESFGMANALTKSIQLLRKEIGAVFDPIIGKAMEAKRAAEASRKEAVEQRAKVEAPLVEAEGILYPKIDAYVQEEKRKAAEEEARIRETARKAIDDAKLGAALEAEQHGDMEAAEAIINTPTTTPKPHVEVPKAASLSFREDWSAEVVNLMELVKAVAAGQAPLAYLMASHIALNQQARSLRGEMRIPGVKAVMKRIPVRG